MNSISGEYSMIRLVDEYDNDDWVGYYNGSAMLVYTLHLAKCNKDRSIMNKQGLF